MDQMRDMRTENASIMFIAKAINYSTATVQKIMKG